MFTKRHFVSAALVLHMHYNTVHFFAVRTMVADARTLGQALCCISGERRGKYYKELLFEGMAEGKYKKTHVFLTMKTMDLKLFVLHSI